MRNLHAFRLSHNFKTKRQTLNMTIQKQSVRRDMRLQDILLLWHFLKEFDHISMRKREFGVCLHQKDGKNE